MEEAADILETASDELNKQGKCYRPDLQASGRLVSGLVAL